MDNKIQTLRKPNSALVMVPKIGRLTPVSRKMYNVMLHRTQRQIGEFVKEGRVIDAKHLFSAPLSELTESISVTGSDTRTLAKQYLREMRRTEVDWEAPDASTGVIWRSMGLLSEADIEIKDGVTWVHWALPPTLLSAVSDPERYTPLDLSQMAKLRNYTAIALYEICSRYKNNPTGVTSKNSPEWWVDALTNAPPSIDLSTGNVKRREWRKLKNESIGKAIEEINEKTDLVVELHEIKEGKAVKEVQFSVQKKRVEQLAPQVTIGADLAEHAARLDVQILDLVKLIKSGVSEGEIKVGLTKLETRLAHPELALVENKLAYLKALIAESGGFIRRETVEVRVAETVGKRDEKSAGSWLAKRTEDLKFEFFKLTKKEQQKYADLVLENFRNTGLATPQFIRKVAAGDWSAGPLLHNMTSAFAVEKYGPDWNVEPEEVTLLDATLAEQS